MNNIAAVIVIYNPDIPVLIHNLDEMSSALSQIILIDNGEVSDEVVDELGVRYQSLVYKKLSKNSGIGTAQNFGVSLLKPEVEYIMFFDQDSWMSSSDINNMRKIYVQTDVTLLGPNYFDTNPRNSVPEIRYVNEIISSGSFISLNTFHFYGKFLESLFIDFIDYEYCWRIISEGGLVARAENIRLHHQIGSKNKAGHSISSPFRNFYFFRNLLVLFRHRLVPRTRYVYLVELAVKRIVFECFFCPNKFKRLQFILQGIHAGFTMRLEN